VRTLNIVTKDLFLFHHTEVCTQAQIQSGHISFKQQDRQYTYNTECIHVNHCSHGQTYSECVSAALVTGMKCACAIL